MAGKHAGEGDQFCSGAWLMKMLRPTHFFGSSAAPGSLLYDKDVLPVGVLGPPLDAADVAL